MQLIGDIVRLSAKRFPQKIALTMEDKCFSYRQLNQQINQLARGIIGLGARPEDKIGILAFNCVEYVVIVYAIAKIGATAVPINFRYKTDELIYVVNNSEISVLFYGSEFTELVEEAQPSFVRTVRQISIAAKQTKAVTDICDLMRGQATSEPGVVVDPASAFAIMYTSGTTGFPKGTLFSHAAYLENFEGMVYEGDLKYDDVGLVCTPLFHNSGFNCVLQPLLMVGGRVILMGKGFDPEKILNAVQRHRISVVMWVPTQLTMLINCPSALKCDTSSLHKIYYGSSAITPATLEGSMGVFRNVGFYQWYGQVETGMVSVLRPEDHKERAQCTGREMFNADLRIVDEAGDDVDEGGVGEIISTQKPLGMIGYYKMDEANHSTIVNGWIHTGDVARVEGGGYFTIVDRLRDMIISGAENIYPKEIEDVMTRHPAIMEAAAFGIPDEIYGEVVCAAVVRKPGHTLQQQELIEFCSARLAGYKKPKRVEFISELPKNANGKVTKNILREPFWVGRSKRV
jgi:fatty-acyl-CoA synthase